MTSSPHLRQYIPFVQERELARLVSLSADRPYSLIFDGVTHVGELVIVILRQMNTETLDYDQNVIALSHLDKSANALDLASVVNVARERMSMVLI